MEEIQPTPPVVAEAATQDKPRTRVSPDSVVRWTELIAGGLAILVLFWKLQFSTQAICCGDFDGYYHMRWAQMLWQNLKAGHIFPPAFTWLPLTSLNPGEYVDHHLLFHVMLIPFTWFRDLQTGAKIATILFATLAVFSCYWLIVKYEIRYRLVWLLALLACSTPFLYRLNMTKAPPLAIIFLIIGAYLLFERKYWLLAPLGFVFAATYDMFVLLGLAVLIWTFVIGWTEERFEWQPLAWVSLGFVLGLVINPYFPRNLHLFYAHARMKITSTGYSTEVGQEWYPYSTWDFFVNCMVALAAMVVGYITYDFSDQKRSQRSLFFLILSTSLMIMTMRWKRIAEYFPPFAILFAAFTLEQFWRGRAVFTHLPDHVLKDLEPFLDRQQPTISARERQRQENWKVAMAVCVAVAIGVALFANVYTTAREIRDSQNRDFYAKGAKWMRENIPAGQTVFNTDWDDFPRLFYFDPTHVYVSGLDPTYLQNKNPQLSDLYERITTGKEEDPGPLIRDRFGARWVFTDMAEGHDAMIDFALSSGWFEEKYKDGECTILYIRDQKSEPPPDDTSDQDDDGDTKPGGGNN